MTSSLKLIVLGLLSFFVNTALCQNFQDIDESLESIFRNTAVKRTNEQATDFQNKICGLGKECVKRTLCRGENIITNGNFLLDIRIEEDDSCSYLEVCCDIRHVAQDESTRNKSPKFSQNNSCGYRNANGIVYKITGNQHNEAEFAEFPWMVMISHTHGSYICGGSLIAPKVVLTNAHYIIDKTPEMLSARVGEWDTETLLEPYIHQNALVTEIICHEGFKPASFHNDIALLILKSPFTLAPNVQPICLPDVNTVLDRNHCISSGWGQNKFGRNGVYQHILKKIELPIVPHATCQAQLFRTRLGRFFQLHPSFICAGGEEGKDMCTGDGGSPLVCPGRSNPERYYQVGIVAWGLGCGTENVPGVYSNVLYLRNWINVKLLARGLDLQYFTP